MKTLPAFLFFILFGSAAEICWSKILRLDDILERAAQANPEIKTLLARADVTLAQSQQQRSIETPQFGFGALFPVESPHSRTAFDMRVSQNIDGFFSLPARIRAANAYKESQHCFTLWEVLKILANVKSAYYRYQSSLEMKALWQSNLEAANAIATLAHEQKRADNISALDEAQHRLFEKMASLEYARIENQTTQFRIALSKLAGLTSEDPSWSIDEHLPRIPAALPSNEDLKQKAFAQQIQLLGYRGQVEAKRLELRASHIQLLPRLNLGVSAEFDPEGNRGIGPFIEFGFPFLGKAQADMRKAEADLKTSRFALEAIQKQLPYEIDELLQRLTLAHQTSDLYQQEIFPLQERMIKESLKHYNFMLLGSYKLLEAKQNAIKAQQDERQARLDYWLANTELELLLGTTSSNFNDAHDSHCELPKEAGRQLDLNDR